MDKIILQKLPQINIDAANVAPEFGYVESMSLFHILRKYKKKKQADRNELTAICHIYATWEPFIKYYPSHMTHIQTNQQHPNSHPS